MCDSLDFDSLDEEECCLEEIGVVHVPHGGGQSVPGKSLQGIDEGLRALERSFTTKIRLIMICYRELQIILKDLESFIQNTQYNFLFSL